MADWVQAAIASSPISGAPPAETAPHQETVFFPQGIEPADSEPQAAVSPSASHLDQSHTLGHYVLQRMLGKGGMGAVWEAMDSRLQRRVAVKVILSDPEGSSDSIERLRREAANAARLRHPNIVTVHDVGQDGRYNYLVMDYVEGITLAEAMRQQPLSYRQMAEILEKTARAVQYAHEQGVVHRDLKPSNIMLEYNKLPANAAPLASRNISGRLGAALQETAFGEPLLMDFGLAKNIQGDATLSQSGQIMGTPAYMPPEQAEGRLKEIGPRSDVYSLGAILYEMLTGRPPFTGENAVKVLQAVLDDDPITPRQLTPDVPRDLETICLKCLEKRPERRYPTATDLALDLRAWLAGEPIQARPQTFLDRLLRRLRRDPAFYAVCTVLGVVLIGGVALWAHGLEQERRRMAEVAAKAVAEYRAAQAARERAERERQAMEEEKKRRWTLVFEEDFSDPRRVESHWEIVSNGGQWEVKNGELHMWGGGPQVAIIKLPIAGDIRLEFECRQESDFLNDVSCFIAALPDGDRLKTVPTSGYLFQYGGNNNTRNAIWRPVTGALWDEKAAPLVKGRRYTVQARRIGGRLTYSIDGMAVIDITDPQPLVGEDRKVVGLYGWTADTYWDNVRVYRLGEPAAADLLEVAERYLERGQPLIAEELFREVLSSTQDQNRRERALRGLERDKPLLNLYRQLPNMLSRIQQAWPDAKVRVAAAGGLAVDIANLDVDDLGPLRDLPVAELKCSQNRIAALEPLRGAPLTALWCWSNSLTSLEPLRGAPLTWLECGQNFLTNLEPLRGMPLRRLLCHDNQITDLEPLRGMPLQHLRCHNNRISDLAPLAGLPLKWLECSNNPLTSLEPFVDNPPAIFIFDCAALPDRELERALAVWTQNPAYAAQAQSARLMLERRRNSLLP